VRHSTENRTAVKHPARGTSLSPPSGRGSSGRGISNGTRAGTLQVVSSTATAERLFVTPPSSGAIFDGAIAAAALAGSLALIAHSDDLDAASAVLATCSAAPLLVWRRSPVGVFSVTATASAVLGGLGYPITLPLGPTAALFLYAASRDDQEPW